MLNNTAIRMAVLFVTAILWLETSHGAGIENPKFNEEISKQESIIRSEGGPVPEGYTIDRALPIYTQILNFEFGRALANLVPTDRWLDIGAGQGQAILDYYAPGYDQTNSERRERRGKKARSVAISIEDRRTPLWHQTAASLEGNQIQYLYNKRLQEYSTQDLGKFQLITDVIGGFSYSVDLSVFMEKVLAILELNGSFHTVLQDVKAEDGRNRPYYAGSPFLTEITNADGSDASVCSWLKSITCVNVTCEFKGAWRPPVESYYVRKICNDIAVPPLVQVHFAAGTPPERRYQIKR